MAESSEIWKLHLVHWLSQIQERFDEDALGKVRPIEGATSVRHRPVTLWFHAPCFFDPLFECRGRLRRGRKCLEYAVDEHNAKGGWWQRK